MPLAVAFSTTGGYGTQPADANGAPWVDPNAGITPNGVVYVPGATPANATAPVASSGYVPVSMAVLSAVLAELRVLNDLTNRNTLNYDLNELRADVASGVTGGVLP
jgi:hypothetical protein